MCCKKKKIIMLIKTTKVQRCKEAKWLVYLHLSNLNPSGLLVKSLVLPVRVEVGQLLGDPVVLPHPDGVVDRQAGLLVGPRVTLARIMVISSCTVASVSTLQCWVTKAFATTRGGGPT